MPVTLSILFITGVLDVAGLLLDVVFCPPDEATLFISPEHSENIKKRLCAPCENVSHARKRVLNSVMFTGC